MLAVGLGLTAALKTPQTLASTLAFIVNGGASDDGFDYFRGWLIAQGREVFEGTLAKPDSLADVIDDPDSEWGFEDQDILNVGLHTWMDAACFR